MADEQGKSGGQEGETHSQRVDRELIEFLNELRVALPGVQVLFAFLLTVPFATGFETTNEFQRHVYFGILASTALAAALLIAPSAWHRLRFRQQDKEHMLVVSNAMAIVGLGFLALAMVGAVVLIANFVFSDALTIVAGAIAFVVFAGLWYVWPLTRQAVDD